MERRSNLVSLRVRRRNGTKWKDAYPDAPPDCTHHKTRLRCCFLLRNHRIWHRSNLQRAWQSLALGYSWSTPRCLSSVGEIEGPWLYLHTKSNHSFSKRSMMISKLSQVTLSFPLFVRSLLTTSSHSWSKRTFVKQSYNGSSRSMLALLVHVVFHRFRQFTLEGLCVVLFVHCRRSGHETTWITYQYVECSGQAGGIQLQYR